MALSNGTPSSCGGIGWKASARRFRFDTHLIHYPARAYSNRTVSLEKESDQLHALPVFLKWLRRKLGPDMNFRRSLPEIRCLSPVCPTGCAPSSPCAPKRLSTRRVPQKQIGSATRYNFILVVFRERTQV